MVEEEGTRILGVGVGLFLLILVWATALSGLVLISRLGSAVIASILSLASIFTLILIVVPRTDHPTEAGTGCARKSS